MDLAARESPSEITLEVHLAGLDEQLAKAHELVETIEKARSLADELDKGLNAIGLEFDEEGEPVEHP